MSYKIIKLVKSPRKNKRYRIYLENNEYFDFGLDGAKTGAYIDHANKKKRDNYRKRHYAQEKKLIDSLTPSPALYSYYLLWGDSTDINKNIEKLNRM